MSDLRLVVEPPLARIVLDRAARRNAISAAMWRAVPGVCAQIEARDDVEAVILEGAGGHFCAGADISEFDDAFADLESTRAYHALMERALTALLALDRPTVARLEGSSVGGGLALALACDLRFCADDAHIAIPPAKLGLVYGPVETRLLVETIGPSAAKDMLFSARAVPAQEALRLGLVNRVLPPAALAGAVETEARAWATLSRASVRGAKQAVRAALAQDKATLHALADAAAVGPDAREGRAAFRDKRAPAFRRGA